MVVFVLLNKERIYENGSGRGTAARKEDGLKHCLGEGTASGSLMRTQRKRGLSVTGEVGLPPAGRCARLMPQSFQSSLVLVRFWVLGKLCPEQLDRQEAYGGWVRGGEGVSARMHERERAQAAREGLPEAGLHACRAGGGTAV